MTQIQLMTIWQSIVTFCTAAAWKIIVTLLILGIGFKLIRIFLKALRRGKGFSKLDAGVQTFLLSGMNIALKAVLIITAAAYIGIPMASMVAVLGSAGLAVGLALQGSLTNVSGGVILLIFKPFKVGDVISVSGETGTVTSIGLFYTYLKTGDNRRVIIPNGQISNEQISNASAEDTRRADLPYSVGYSADLKQVRNVILSCAAACDAVLDAPKPEMVVKEHADSAVIVELRVWCKTEDYWKAVFALNESVKEALDAANIEIPFPQMDVHMK